MAGKTITKILVANRSEIAIRIVRAAYELGLEAVNVYSDEDHLTLHRFSGHEAYRIGHGLTPTGAYLDIDEMLRVARQSGCDAVHPGYGFLSENPDFAEACAEAGITFIGPRPEVMRRLGNKVQARQIAEVADVPVMPATEPLPDDPAEISRLAAEIGYPVMLKASWGGGGRGMRVIEDERELHGQIEMARREAKAAFGNDEVYLEKLVRRARHVEVQVLGDEHGNVVHLFERDCSVQRRHQKVVERAPAPYLDDAAREDICNAALRLARSVDYTNAGTVEFLQDVDTGAFYFIEVNPRVQVEHTVTEQVTGLDIVKSQIQIAAGGRIGDPDTCGIPAQADIRMRGSALQCRVTTEDPRNNFIPDFGRIVAYRSPAGPGIRLDAGTAYSGAVITRHYDSLLVKVTASGQNDLEAVHRMRRALGEFRVRGVETNLEFLQGLVTHPRFLEADYNTRFIDETPELLDLPLPQTHATKLVHYIGEVIVNGNAQVEGRARPASRRAPEPPPVPDLPVADGVRQILERDGPEAVARWLKEQPVPVVTDTTFRDAHQSLLATRMRSIDMLRIAPHYARLMPGLFSVESWGGATFDVAMRFLKEDPWQRLADLSEAMPNLMQQMLLRASNGVGYTNYPDNVVRHFTHRAAEAGVDVFRIFDCLNWVENMRVAIDSVRETGKIAEAAICYTGDILDPGRPKYDLAYYVELAKELEAAGAHILAIKDMAGLLKPAAATKLITALKQEIGLPIHFHTHDTSGAAVSSILAAVAAGVDAFDTAMDAMSGLTSQPCMGSAVAALKFTDHDTGLDETHIRTLSNYWEQVRGQYAAFEPDIRAGASEVYLHEMPGGQFTNLKEQANSLGIGRRWHEVARAYADVNQAFGDIVKVTPSSKVVGDMALMMVTQDITIEQVCDPERDISFPDSVVALFAGELGQPPGGFPRDLQKKVLRGKKPLTDRPGKHLEPVDLEAEREKLSETIGRPASELDLASHNMYPKVFGEFEAHWQEYGDVSVLPTHVFFYGMEPGEDITVTIVEDGRQAVIRYLTASEADPEGVRHLFFEVNGWPASVRIADNALAHDKVMHERADLSNPKHVAAPMPGLIVSVAVEPGQKVERGDPLLTMEAMKMETAVSAEREGTVKRVVAGPGAQVEAKDLLIEFE
ncbi:pyruvate carboxylase [Lentisalinibacter salinarum]|uniref:pyruvate carboxylase n=1 Tax=Lentisalinibacter salinarum TaxID=2992239 RepID=UPI00386973A0